MFGNSTSKTSKSEDASIAVLEDVQRRYDEVISTMERQLTDEEQKKLDKAFQFAAKAHKGQYRVSGEPYIMHPLETMAILSELKVDSVTLIASLLHDVIEDTGFTVDDIAREFGPVVGILVEGMTKLKSLRYETKSNEDRQAEYFRKMLLSMAQDLRVILIKLADRLHNMRTLSSLPQKSRKRIARETLDIYAPLAHRFGIGRIKWELEDLSLKNIDEVVYRRIAERVSTRRDERENMVKNFIDPLKDRLKKEGIEAKVFGRAKHFYSIYNKMKKRGKSFEEIMDLLAVRVIVPSVSDCYRTLGVVHSTFTPILERFGDYIAMPKANMYQSLHTKVMDHDGNIIEVQIRTHEMDLISEVGIAAHWQYKEGGKTQQEIGDYYSWIRQLIEGSREEDSGSEFMKTLKINLFTDEIFAFTPQGKLIRLPKGATPVDFAFTVHTDIGLTTIGAKVNGRIVPLDHHLSNGDTVQVLTSSAAKPSGDWLRFVKSHRARAKIKKFFKTAQFEQSVQLGEEMLKREASKSKKKFTNQELIEVANSHGHVNIETFYAAIGAGDLSAQTVLNRYFQDKPEETKVSEDRFQFLRGIKKEAGGVRVKGADNLVIRFGTCCNPIPGEKIFGYISKGRGIVVHTNDCPNFGELTKDEKRLVELEWDASPDDRFIARLRILTEDRQHMLRDLAEVLSKQGVTVLEMNLRTEGAIGIGIVAVEVRSLSHLQKVKTKLNRLKGVVQVDRIGIADIAEKLV